MGKLAISCLALLVAIAACTYDESRLRKQVGGSGGSSVDSGSLDAPITGTGGGGALNGVGGASGTGGPGGGDANAPDVPGSSGVLGTGGASGLGGGMNTGGTAGTGGVLGTGGAPISGGKTGTGGSAGTGGLSGAGGRTGSGGSTGGGGAAGTGGTAGGGSGGTVGIEYTGCVWVGGLDHMGIEKRDLEHNLCLALALATPATNRSEYTVVLPANWGLLGATASPCTGLGSSTSATSVTGTILWSPGSTLGYLPDTVDVDLILQFGVDAGLGETQVFSAKQIPIMAGC